MRARTCAALVASMACAGPGAPRPRPDEPAFRIDADFSEWAAVPVAAGNGREVPGPDLREIRALADAEALHLLLDFERTVNLQSMTATLRLALDGDGDPATGERVAGLAGADLVLDMSAIPPGAEAGAGMRLRLAGDSTTRSVYEAGYAYAPTHSSARFEVGIERLPEGRPLLAGRTLRALVVMLDAAGAPTEVFGPFPIEAPPARARTAGRTLTLDRANGTNLRVLAWNVSDDAALRRPDPFRRVLRAAAPDIVLLDELHPDLDEERIRGLLPAAEDWTVLVGTAGGRQRTAVASRLPLRESAIMRRVEWPDSVAALAGLPMLAQVRQDLATAAADGIPTMGAVATLGTLRLLLVPIDLSCCGRDGSPEDRARVIAASAVNRAAYEALAAGEADAVMIGGDLNLVGSRRPLDVLAAGLDPSGGALQPAQPITPDSRTFATWRSPGPFPPGRLDWVLFPASVLEPVGGMVLDAALLSGMVRAGTGLEATDSEVADHLPLIIDFALRARAPTARDTGPPWPA